MFVAGLPASGKSLVVRQAALVAADLGRPTHLLQWDVVRLPFDTPAILARYPEVGGVTHAAIRLAAGMWSRGAVERWHREHPDPREILIGEVPLVGERLMQLARPRADGVERLLATDRTVFLVPVPSREVRGAIEVTRARDMAAPRHARDAKSAPPDLVSAHWSDLLRVARAIGASAGASDAYDPHVYAGVYRRLLRHRHVSVVPLDRVIPVDGSVHEPPAGASEIEPSADEVAAAMASVERLAPEEIRRRADEWYRESVLGRWRSSRAPSGG